MDIAVVYRSQEGKQSVIVDFVETLISDKRTTIVMGDFNLCAIKDRNSFLNLYMEIKGFKQIVTKPTHILGNKNFLQLEHHL